MTTEKKIDWELGGAPEEPIFYSSWFKAGTIDQPSEVDNLISVLKKHNIQYKNDLLQTSSPPQVRVLIINNKENGELDTENIEKFLTLYPYAEVGKYKSLAPKKAPPTIKEQDTDKEEELEIPSFLRERNHEKEITDKTFDINSFLSGEFSSTREIGFNAKRGWEEESEKNSPAIKKHNNDFTPTK